MARISVGLPIYNGDEFLRETLDSLLNQTFSDFELIISDNGSTDKTPDICREYAEKDHRIQLHLHERNRGAAWNYNHVFHLAQGQYFKWASCDDICEPSFLEECLAVLDQNEEAILCYPQTSIIDGHGNVVSHYDDGMNYTVHDPLERLQRFLMRTKGECNAVFGLIRTETLRKTFLIGNYNSSDINLLAHLCLLGEIVEVPQRLFLRRDHPHTSLRMNQSAEEIAIWFDPAKAGTLVFPFWRLLTEFYRSVLHADLDSQTRRQCLLFLGRFAWWHKDRLFKDIRQSFETSGKDNMKRC